MAKAELILLAILHAVLVIHGTPLDEKYRFRQMLDSDGMYWLHWSFDIEENTISFAVNVSTTGWVGFGLSPNGQMPGSDVVIGWVDDRGTTYFHDRSALGRYEPEIDTSQDWFLTGSSEHGGHTVLEFERNLTVCGERDLDITADTSRIIWSWAEDDPQCITGVARHSHQGAKSLNLLGGLNQDVSAEVSSEDTFFEIRNENLLIPSNSDTTYWCHLSALPAPIVDEEHYVYRISPVITPHNHQFVHHMVVFLCPSYSYLPPPSNYSDNCHRDVPNFYITICTNTRALGSWAIGGEDLQFPDGVRFPIGGPGNDHYLVLETHYDNPNLAPDTLDSSGMRFYYTSTPPTHRAGIMTLGHDISKIMIIPPTTEGYVTSGICTSSCTEQFFPSEGITIFANIFHTHLIGRGLKLRHYTQNDSSCDGWKELEPIDENTNYDFNYQQYNILQRSRTVMPGDMMELECLYRTDRDRVTLGGDSTQEEMCLSFVAYYPSLDLSVCVSRPAIPALQIFTDQYIPAEQSEEVETNLRVRNTSGIEGTFNSIHWTAQAVSDLEASARNGTVDTLCIIDIVVSQSQLPGGVRVQIPNIECPYEPPAKQCPDIPSPVTDVPTDISASSCTTSLPTTSSSFIIRPPIFDLLMLLASVTTLCLG